jgi:hypothetical protein
MVSSSGPAGWIRDASRKIKADNWAGDGQSTILFDRYACFHPGSAVFSVDRDPEAAALCRSLVGDRVHVHAGDSLAYLKSLAARPPPALEFADLLYLDSLDVDPLPRVDTGLFPDTSPGQFHRNPVDHPMPVSGIGLPKQPHAPPTASHTMRWQAPARASLATRGNPRGRGRVEGFL